MPIVTPTTDLAPFIGKRVRIDKTVRGDRYTFYGVFETLRHLTGERSGGGPPFAGGMLLVEAGNGNRGGTTGFDLQYDGTTTIELA